LVLLIVLFSLFALLLPIYVAQFVVKPLVLVLFFEVGGVKVHDFVF
jgi:hypothetical protein